MTAPKQPTRIQSVERAARLLMAVAEHATDGTGKALAAAVGLAAPTAHHLLGTLVSEGLLDRDDAGRYILGPAVGVLADSFSHALAVPAHLSGPLHRLAERTGETTYLAAWRSSDVVVLGCVEGTLPVRVTVPTAGPYRDAHARAAGKALLAFAPDDQREDHLARNPLRRVTPRTITDRRRLDAELAAVRESGVATDEEELTPGVCCVAVPLRRGGRLFSYAMSLPSQRFEQRRHEIVEALLATARAVADHEPRRRRAAATR